MKSNENIKELILSRILIEKLTLKRNPSDYQAYIETFRETLIDTNPHQIESVVFALEKLENGGCILADEVGLGKTIEAGLVISQYRARRKFNVLITVPTSLAGQWQNQLKDLFNLNSLILTSFHFKTPKDEKLNFQDGIYIIGRELASNLEKNGLLSKIKDWDLIIVDEAHEIFANIYNRFNSKDGTYNKYSKSNQRAGNLYYFFLKTPILLLTATPIQNDILELWGLSSYISEKNYLGELHHFNQLFLKKGDVNQNNVEELRYRIGNFLVRNLRKDAELYMKYKFTDRFCEVIAFKMTDEEKSLYNDVSNYFDDDGIVAYETKNTIELKSLDVNRAKVSTLLKLSFRKMLGSSFSALSSGLKTVLNRLNSFIIDGSLLDEDILPEDENLDEYKEYVEEKYPTSNDDNSEKKENKNAKISEKYKDPKFRERLEKEIDLVKSFIDRADKIKLTEKDTQLLNMLKNKIFNDAERFFEKAVIFTQSLASVKYLKLFFEANGFLGQVVTFSGSNSGSDVEKAVRIWTEEVGCSIPPNERPEGEALSRQALVYYFKHYGKIFISTEAGAKGLNLQFCNVIINYDLPWNPQRIEQRIGRCHRYKQTKDVLVINCINTDNETETRIYDILANKFKLFVGTLDSSNEILGGISSAINFEMRINEILNDFKTDEERKIMLKKFEEELTDETKNLINTKITNTKTLINNLDTNVKQKLKNIAETIPEYFSEYDKDILSLIKYYSKINDVKLTEKRENNATFLEYDNDKKYYIGSIDENNKDYEHINLKNNFITQIIDFTKNSLNNNDIELIFNYSESKNKSLILKDFVGYEGSLTFCKVNYKGIEEEERIYNIAFFYSDNLYFLNEDEISELLRLEITARTSDKQNNLKIIERKIDEIINGETVLIQNAQQPRIDKKLHNLRIELKDTENYLKKQADELTAEIEKIEKNIRETIDNEKGKKLINEKRIKQTKLSNIEEDLLIFKKSFDRKFREEENKLLEKRFLDVEKEIVFTYEFKII
ncbi:MAG TPA: SNF2-related protein [Spirochaetota bacterium]|nr:SNF2-related protein [Spirochaetota bacterium]